MQSKTAGRPPSRHHRRESKKRWGLDRVCRRDEAGSLWSCSPQGRQSLIKCNAACPRAASQFHIGTWKAPARKFPVHVNRGLGLPKLTPRPGQWQAAELVDSPVVPTFRIHLLRTANGMSRAWRECGSAGAPPWHAAKLRLAHVFFPLGFIALVRAGSPDHRRSADQRFPGDAPTVGDSFGEGLLDPPFG